MWYYPSSEPSEADDQPESCSRSPVWFYPPTMSYAHAGTATNK